MNPIALHHSPPHRHWRKDVQFAVGVMVALGGAGVLVANSVPYFW